MFAICIVVRSTVLYLSLIKFIYFLISFAVCYMPRQLVSSLLTIDRIGNAFINL